MAMSAFRAASIGRLTATLTISFLTLHCPAAAASFLVDQTLGIPNADIITSGDYCYASAAAVHKHTTAPQIKRHGTYEIKIIHTNTFYPEYYVTNATDQPAQCAACQQRRGARPQTASFGSASADADSPVREINTCPACQRSRIDFDTSTADDLTD